MANIIEIAVEHLREIMARAVDRSLSGQYHSRSVTVANITEGVNQFKQDLEGQDVAPLGIVQPDGNRVALTFNVQLAV
jgi:hypothetical protein